MITTERPPGNDAGAPGGPACPDGRLLALRCSGTPQVATRAAMSRRRTLLRSLTAFCPRIRPRQTAELALLLLYLGEEIDRREQMLDATLQAMATPCPASGSPGARQHPNHKAGPSPGGRPTRVPAGALRTSAVTRPAVLCPP
jgi:hypothetical protein